MKQLLPFFVINLILSMLVGPLGAETLYNGIRLPAEWPVNSRDPKSRAPMDVP